MAANTSPIFVLTPNVGRVSISTANTNRDGTGTLGTSFTAGANGSRIDRIVIKATATVTSGMVRTFLHDGSTFYLLDETIINATTPTASVQTFVGYVNPGYFPLILPTGWTIRSSTHNAETFHVTSHGADY